jgi:hypothetical protein
MGRDRRNEDGWEWLIRQMLCNRIFQYMRDKLQRLQLLNRYGVSLRDWLDGYHLA